MSAKAYDKKTAAFAGFLIQNIPGDLKEGDMDYWMNDPAATKKFFAGLKLPKLEEEASTFILLKGLQIGRIRAGSVGSFKLGKRWTYYGGDHVSSRLPPVWPELPPCKVGVYQLQNRKGATSRDMALATLKVPPGTSNEELGRLLKKRELTLTLPALDNLIGRYEDGEDVGLVSAGPSNLAFVEDAKGGISALSFRRMHGEWGEAQIEQVSFERDAYWPKGCCLILRNLITRSL